MPVLTWCHYPRGRIFSVHGSLSTLDALIIASPSNSNKIHRLAIEAGCHVIDVGINENAIRAALTLSEETQNKSLKIVLMAGLAPGLSGLMAHEMALRFPAATCVSVVLVQSAKGAAGKRGVVDMLDMLTDPMQAPMTTLTDLFDLASLNNKLKAFVLPTPERNLLPRNEEGPEFHYFTIFDASWMNQAVIFLRVLRQFSSGLYQVLRDAISVVKSNQVAPSSEDVTLVAIAVGADGEPIGREEISFPSDYGATARVACELTRMSVINLPPHGVGHPLKFTDFSSLTCRAFPAEAVRAAENGGNT